MRETLSLSSLSSSILLIGWKTWTARPLGTGQLGVHPQSLARFQLLTVRAELWAVLSQSCRGACLSSLTLIQQLSSRSPCSSKGRKRYLCLSSPWLFFLTALLICKYRQVPFNRTLAVRLGEQIAFTLKRISQERSHCYHGKQGGSV